MPVYLTPDQVHHRNLNHHSEISKLLKQGLEASKAPAPPIQRPPGDEDINVNRRRSEHQRDVAENRARDRVGDMLSLPDDVQRKEIPMSDIMNMMNAQHDAVLKNPWFVRVTSNRQRVNCEFLLENLEDLLKQVPLRCKEFDLLPVQRLAIMCMVVAMPFETFTHCEIPREAMEELTEARRRKEPFDIRYCVEANALPTFTIADFWCVDHALGMILAHTPPPTLCAPFPCSQHRQRQDHHGHPGHPRAALLPPALGGAQGLVPRRAQLARARGTLWAL